LLVRTGVDVVVSIYSRKASSIQAAVSTGITVKVQARNKDEKDTFITGRVARVSDRAQDVIPDGIPLSHCCLFADLLIHSIFVLLLLWCGVSNS
jgi:hypothetical protein